MSTIALCPRCNRKFVDTTEEILCDSCDAILKGEKEQELAEITQEDLVDQAMTDIANSMEEA